MRGPAYARRALLAQRRRCAAASGLGKNVRSPLPRSNARGNACR